MRTRSSLKHRLDHTGLNGVTPDQHHLAPSNIETSNTTDTVDPLPGGPTIWDISVPYDAIAVHFAFRSNHSTEFSTAKAGVRGVATRSLLEASAFSVGGHGTLGTSSYHAVYSKKAACIDLSHTVFSASGDDICLTEAYLYESSPGVRVFRTVWTNYGVSTKTLSVYAEIGVFA